MDRRKLIDSKGDDVHLHIDEPGLPQSSAETTNSSNTTPISSLNHASVKKLILFALQLAVLEKMAKGIGALGFIWVSVVLLGRFSVTLDKTDIWFMTIIMLLKGIQISSKSMELEWQFQVAGWSLPDHTCTKTSANSHIVIKACITGETRTWTSSDVPLLPYGQWFSLASNVCRILYWVQVASAMACVVLSLLKLIRHNYGELANDKKASLTIFYALALAEALLFLLENAYWEWKVIISKLLDKVNEECDLGPTGMVFIRRFFYEVYTKSVNGSIFDGLKMDMVSFAMELLRSSSPNELLIGIRILHKFTANTKFRDYTLRNIRITKSVVERLGVMLTWKDPQNEEIRRSAEEILSKLASKEQDAL